MGWKKEHNRFYYVFMFVIIFLMIIGLVAAIPESRMINLWHYFHLWIVILLACLLLMYPKKSTFMMRFLIILTGIIFFYLMLYLYPETRFSFILICFIPAVAILFFDRKLFYFSLVANLCLFVIGYFYLYFLGGDKFHFLEVNIVGNFTNFLGSQAIIYFIFRMFIERIQEQQLYYEQLQQSERQRMTGQLAAAVAHEIRNPLTVVKGFLQLYERDEKIDKEAKGHFHLMIDELEVAEHVISQFLTVSKPDKDLPIIEIDMELALNSVVDLVRTYGLLRDNSISLLLEENCMLRINRIEFNQLMINIVKNAMEASKQGQEVQIHTKIDKKRDMVEISVVDYGRGMDQEEVKLLGVPFYSLKSKGTGLGMMISFNIVEKFKGKMKIYSKKGIGTTVRIYLPLERKKKRKKG